jgi:hypothetical protein
LYQKQPTHSPLCGEREAAADTALVELTAHENLYIICTARPEIRTLRLASQQWQSNVKCENFICLVREK